MSPFLFCYICLSSLIFRYTDMWKYTVFVLLCLIWLSIILSRSTRFHKWKCFLAIARNFGMNIEVHIYFQIYVFIFFRLIFRSGIAGHQKLFNVLNIYTIFNADCINLHSMKVYKRSLFFTFLPIFIIPCLFDVSHSDRYEVMAHCFDLHFPISNVELFFMYLLAIYLSSLEKFIFIFSWPFKKNGFVLGYSWLTMLW